MKIVLKNINDVAENSIAHYYGNKNNYLFAFLFDYWRDAFRCVGGWVAEGDRF